MRQSEVAPHNTCLYCCMPLLPQSLRSRPACQTGLHLILRNYVASAASSCTRHVTAKVRATVSPLSQPGRHAVSSLRSGASRVRTPQHRVAGLKNPIGKHLQTSFICFLLAVTSSIATSRSAPAGPLVCCRLAPELQTESLELPPNNIVSTAICRRRRSRKVKSTAEHCRSGHVRCARIQSSAQIHQRLCTLPQSATCLATDSIRDASLVAKPLIETVGDDVPLITAALMSESRHSAHTNRSCLVEKDT
jgi:hypothetical protein